MTCPRNLVDEDLPRTLAAALRSAGVDASDVRDAGLRGAPDADVLAFAVQEQRAVITGDVGFGNIVRFPLGQHPGIVVIRLPNELSSGDLAIKVTETLAGLSSEDVVGNVVTISTERVRIRRAWSRVSAAF